LNGCALVPREHGVRADREPGADFAATAAGRYHSRMRRYSYVHVDVFTHARFGGNQLAVFTDGRGLSDTEMQSIAREMNFAETTFVLPPEDPAHDARVRIFTTVLELPFAGHPTVGTAWVLGRDRDRTAVTLELGVGPIPVSVDASEEMEGSATMRQPLPEFHRPELSRLETAALLGMEPGDLGDYAPIEVGSAGAPFLFVPLRSLAELADANGYTREMASALESPEFHGVYCFALGGADENATARARMFHPGPGGSVQEDPATGSAAGPFGAYLVRHGLVPPGSMAIEQGYEMGRPSQLQVTVDTAGEEITTVSVGGGVVLVATGEMVV
jgi:trans-2,3-dihydro-3-hydroxyanthranilate isomerase